MLRVVCLLTPARCCQPLAPWRLSCWVCQQPRLLNPSVLATGNLGAVLGCVTLPERQVAGCDCRAIERDCEHLRFLLLHILNCALGLAQNVVLWSCNQPRNVLWLGTQVQAYKVRDIKKNFIPEWNFQHLGRERQLNNQMQNQNSLSDHQN